MAVKEKIKKNVVWFVFLSVFVLVGFTVLVFGLVRTGVYLNAEIKPATVLSAEYGAGETVTVEFEYIKDGAPVKVTAEFEDVALFDEQGRRPYYEGKEVDLRLNKSGEVVQFTKLEILMLVCGSAFLLAGCLFIYFMFLRNPSAIELAYSYEQAMVSPEEYTDETQKTEAYADELSKLPQKSLENLSGQTKVWRRRLGDRLKTFTPLQNIMFAVVALLPPLAYDIYRAVIGGKFRFGAFVIDLFIWVFCICILGFMLKLIYYFILNGEVRAGKYNTKKTAKVIFCAFESESSFSSGEFDRVHIVNRKFRVVAEIDGKRSVGYVYGNVPPPKGAVLRVLVRAKNSRRFVIDRDVF